MWNICSLHGKQPPCLITMLSSAHNCYIHLFIYLNQTKCLLSKVRVRGNKERVTLMDLTAPFIYTCSLYILPTLTLTPKTSLIKPCWNGMCTDSAILLEVDWEPARFFFYLYTRAWRSPGQNVIKENRQSDTALIRVYTACMCVFHLLVTDIANISYHNIYMINIFKTYGMQHNIRYVGSNMFKNPYF